MYYAICLVIGFVAGFVVAWIYKTKVAATIQKGKDDLKKSATDLIGKV